MAVAMSTDTVPPAGTAAAPDSTTAGGPPLRRGPVTSASYSLTIRLTADGDPSSIGRIATAVGSAGGVVTAIDVVESRSDGLTVDVTCSAADAAHSEEMVEALRGVPGVKVRKVSDRTFLLHLGINLEEIAAPRCFEIEARLREKLDIPVFHDDQHGTAIVALAALKNALRVVDKNLADVKIVVAGGGAAGTAIVQLLLKAGATNVLVWDREGILSPDDDRLSGAKLELARQTNSAG